MADRNRTIFVGWEHEVPLDEVQMVRDMEREQLEASLQAPADSLTDLEIARYLVRRAHPSTRYLRADVEGLGYRIRTA